MSTLSGKIFRIGIGLKNIIISKKNLILLTSGCQNRFYLNRRERPNKRLRLVLLLILHRMLR